MRDSREMDVCSWGQGPGARGQGPGASPRVIWCGIIGGSRGVRVAISGWLFRVAVSGVHCMYAHGMEGWARGSRVQGESA